MRKNYRFIALCAAVCLVPSFCISGGEKSEKIYQLYNSTATPKAYRQVLEKAIPRREEALASRAGLKAAAKKRAAAARTAAVSATVAPSSADATFRLGEVYCYPNPAKKVNPVFHIEAGLADKVELAIYNTAGESMHQAALTGIPQLIDDGQGSQYAFEYSWDVSRVASGVYIFGVTARQGDKTLKKTGRCAVIK